MPTPDPTPDPTPGGATGRGTPLARASDVAGPPNPLRAGAFVAAMLALTTVAVAIVESEAAGQLEGSPLYLVAVVVAASRYRTAGGIATAILAFLVYNLLFTEPRFTFQVADPREWLNLVLFLFVAVVIGRLTAVSAERAIEEETRAREATVLYLVARTLAAEAPASALREVVRLLVSDAGMRRAWITVDDGGVERVAADSEASTPTPAPATTVAVLMREGTEPRWQATHVGGSAAAPARRESRRGPASERWFRVRLAAGDATLGSLWAIRDPAAPEPDRAETRLLALAADQVALAVQRDRLRAEALDAEMARRDAALKTALIDSVSHDLRTPLAGIRATAGTLADAEIERSPEAVRAAASTIETETVRLDRMVGGLLDLSRIQAGAIRSSAEAVDVQEAVRDVVDRLRPLLGERVVTVEIPADLPPAAADPLFLDQCLANLVENVVRHTPPTAHVTLRAGLDANGRMAIEVEDDGPGVSEAVAARLFDRFYRAPGAGPARGGMGVGLTIVRGLTEAMGGSVEAARGAAGGLVVRLRLDAAPPPAEAR